MTDSSYRSKPYRPERLDPELVAERAREDLAHFQSRRSVRHFSTDPVPRELIETAIAIAGTAPSGAHRQPWYFVAIGDPALKERIREAAEKEERDFYERRAPEAWLEALAPLGTDFVKEHLTDAPWLIVIFARAYELDETGERIKSYYVQESVGIAVGFLISALHRLGLATLTHTPAPMTFLREVLGRPDNERPFVIMPVGYPSDECTVPDIERKKFGQIAEFR